MHVLLVAATHREIRDAALFFEEKKNRANPHEIQITITGIGLLSTAYGLTKLVNDRRPDLIIQAGIAGSFSKDKNAGVVAVKEEVLADMGVYEENRFKTIFDLGLADKNDRPFTNGSLSNPYQKLLSLAAFDQVKAVSINEITTNKTRIDWYQQNFDPVVESMEGAAFHFVCLQEEIPFLQIRSISNDIGERDKSKWNIKKSIDTLNEQLILLINKLDSYDETYFRI